MSKHTDKYPEFDGSGDWKTWTGKIRPKLFKKKSQAYPDKTAAGWAPWRQWARWTPS